MSSALKKGRTLKHAKWEGNDRSAEHDRVMQLGAHQGLHVLIKAACLSLLQAPALRGPPVLLIHIICSNITGASQAPLCCVPSECINDAACTMFLCHPRTKGAATAAELQSQRPGMLDHVQQEQTPPSRRAAGRRVRLTPCALSISRSARSRACSRSSKVSPTSSSSMSRLSYLSSAGMAR